MVARALVQVSAWLFLTAGGAAAQAAPTQPDTAAITPAMVAAGRAIFHGKGTCFACHGMKLEGTQIAPTLIKTVWKDAKGGDIKAIHNVATHGVPGTLMVPFPGGITPAEAVSVVAYIWSVNNRKEKP
ncbi:MAG: c-type cytochrome [Gemmatimonadales bacterium]